jgi:hypothetical protein
MMGDVLRKQGIEAECRDRFELTLGRRWAFPLGAVAGR